MERRRFALIRQKLCRFMMLYTCTKIVVTVALLITGFFFDLILKHGYGSNQL